MLSLLCEIYCKIHWLITGRDPLFEARARGLQRLIMAGKGLGAAIRKLFMSSASSAVGTGTVLGLHMAMLPEEARIQDSTLYNPTIDESKALFKMDFAGARAILQLQSLPY